MSSNSSSQEDLQLAVPIAHASQIEKSQGNGENIQVFLRLRPLNNKELVEDQQQHVWRILDNAITLDPNAFNSAYQNQANTNANRLFSYASTAYNNIIGGSHTKAYSFNKCFDDESSNEKVYFDSCRDIVLSSLEGINGTIFMYGQTGAGKTFTMLGDHYLNDIKEQAAHHFLNLKRAGSARGSKTPLKGSFAGSNGVPSQTTISNASQQNPQTVIQNGTTSANDQIGTNQVFQISPISSQKAIQNQTPLRKMGTAVPSSTTNQTNHNRMSHSSIPNNSSINGWKQHHIAHHQHNVTETPRHIKNNVSNNKLSVSSKLPPPISKQQSQPQTSKTRNHFSYKSSQQVGLHVLNQYATNNTIAPVSEFNSSNIIGQMSQSIGPNEQPSAFQCQTERSEYANYIQNEDLEGTEFTTIGSQQQLQTMKSARNLDFQSQSMTPSLKSQGILIQSLKDLFNQIKKEQQQSTFTFPNNPQPHSSSSSENTPFSSTQGSFIATNAQSNNGQQQNTFGKPQKVYIIRCSYFEIYNDAVYDLLHENGHESFNEPLQLNEDIKKKEFFVRNLREHVVESFDDCLNLLKLGEVNRHYAETKMNHQSSRSHTLFRLHVESVGCASGATDGANVITESILNFVDLAGSEKISNHVSQDQNNQGGGLSGNGSQTRRSVSGYHNYQDSTSLRVKEGQHINKSLFFLTQVIALKAEGKKNEQHIPYRNSPLTKILRSSLGGNSRTAIILCATPAGNQLEQTFSTLRFGQNAKMIQNKVVANVVKKASSSEDEVELKAMLSEYERKLGEMEKDKQQNNAKLKEVIDALLREKDELNQRLINANNRKLFNMMEQSMANGAQQQNVQQRTINLSEQQDQQQQVKSYYIWNCGVINSYQAIDGFINKNPNLLLNRHKDLKQSYLVDYVLSLTDKLEQGNSKLFMKNLRAAKKDNRDLRGQMQIQENRLESALNENQALKDQIHTLTKQLEDQIGKNDKQRKEFEDLTLKYVYLQETRYELPPNSLVQENLFKLQEIEMQLFRGIQKINMERGRRENYVTNHVNGSARLSRPFMSNSDYNHQNHKLFDSQNNNDIDEGYNQQIQMSSNDHQPLDEADQSSSQLMQKGKSTFLVVDDSEVDDFLARTYNKKLDFDMMDNSNMNNYQRVASTLIKNPHTQSDDYLSAQFAQKFDQDIESYQPNQDADDSIIAYSQATTTKKQKRQHRDHSVLVLTPLHPQDQVKVKANDIHQQQALTSDFIDSNDISQITAVNQRQQQQVPLGQIILAPNSRALQTQKNSQNLEEDTTIDEKTRLQEKCQIFQRQISNMKVDKYQLKENTPEKTPIRPSQVLKNMRSQQHQNQMAHSNVLKTPTSQVNVFKEQPMSLNKFTLDNEFNESLRQMMYPSGSLSSKAAQSNQTHSLENLLTKQSVFQNFNLQTTDDQLVQQERQSQLSGLTQLLHNNNNGQRHHQGRNQDPYMKQSNTADNQMTASQQQYHTFQSIASSSGASVNTVNHAGNGGSINTNKPNNRVNNRTKYLSKDVTQIQYMDESTRKMNGDSFNLVQVQLQNQQQHKPSRML